MPRLVGASVVIAVLVCVAIVALIVAASSSRRSVEQERHAKDVSAATLTLEKVVADLESGLRGYVLTRDARFLKPWRKARTELEPAEERLLSLVGASLNEELSVDALRGDLGSYIEDYSLPLIRIAKLDAASARSPVAQLEGKRRTDAIRGRLTTLRTSEDRASAQRAEDVRRETRNATAIAFVALAASVLLVLVFGVYLTAVVARPVRRAAAAAGRVAAGDFGDRLPEGGPDELGDLGRAFNSMARSLDHSRGELLHQNEMLAQAERQKSELISIVSHEVRTPLSSLLGFTDLLLRRELDEPTRRRYLEIVHQESRRLASLTADFLEVRLLEEGRLALELDRVDLAAVAREQARVFLAQSEEHDLVLDVPEQPLWVRADRDRLSQVVGNLVANAVKYSPHGGEIAIRAALDDGRARLEVEDHGVGIPLDDQPLIFTKFYRGRAAASGIPGTGLGLAISRELVAAHGGTLEFRSRLGHGSTFVVELPAAA